MIVPGGIPLACRRGDRIIIAGQRAEIEALKARLQILSRGADPNPGGYPPLGGTRAQ
jgi:hypothetical protein